MPEQLETLGQEATATAVRETAVASAATAVPETAAVSEELASRLRLSINRLHRLLRQESLAGLSPAQASALGAVNRLGSPTLG